MNDLTHGQTAGPARVTGENAKIKPATVILGGVGHCFARHVRVSLRFYFNFKTENLYIVGCVHNSIFPAARIKILR
jgi:hypothetical protein